jgi:hypothetical protein
MREMAWADAFAAAAERRPKPAVWTCGFKSSG